MQLFFKPPSLGIAALTLPNVRQERERAIGPWCRSVAGCYSAGESGCVSANRPEARSRAADDAHVRPVFHRRTLDYRNDVNAARSSSAKSCGCGTDMVVLLISQREGVRVRGPDLDEVNVESVDRLSMYGRQSRQKPREFY